MLNDTYGQQCPVKLCPDRRDKPSTRLQFAENVDIQTEEFCEDMAAKKIEYVIMIVINDRYRHLHIHET